MLSAYHVLLIHTKEFAVTASYCALEQDALLHIVGPDTLKFLQGQTTCDTETVSDTLSVPGAYCTPQGRVVCDFLLSRLGDDHYALRMRGELIDNSAAVFGKYIIFSKADLQPEQQDWQCIGVWGSSAAQVLEGLLGTAPSDTHGVTRGAGVIAVRLPGAEPAFECYAQGAAADALLAHLDTACAPGTEAAWQGLQIKAGIARVALQTIESFVPQIINYDLTGHVNFKKGCYTGQEVVARLHYRGTPKRRTFITRLEGSDIPEPGTPLFAGDSEQSVGNIVNAALDGDAISALAAVTVEAAEASLRLASPGGPTLAMELPPYPLETA